MRILWVFLMVPALWSASIHTIAGSGQAGYSGDGGLATEAQIKGPFGVLKGPDDGLYICDTYNHVIRRMDQNGNITTVAGTGQKGYSGDGGPATQARLNEPYEIRIDAAGNLVFVEMQTISCAKWTPKRVASAPLLVPVSAALAAMAVQPRKPR